ncbi:MAG: hypothetical protein COS17_07525, partial [Elusimicrobia bacterium CG02_land_8_20_14_3_00_37_13]
MNSNCSDMRFTDDTSARNELPYWIEDGIYSTTTIVWVRVPYIPPNQDIYIYMCYGNTSAVTSSNIGGTFIYGEDFDSGAEGWTFNQSSDTVKWHITSYRNYSQYQSLQYSTGTYSEPGTYDNNLTNWGECISPAFNMPIGTELQFKSWSETEGGITYDKRLVYISTDNGTYWVSVSTITDPLKAWIVVSSGTLDYSGSQCKIKFLFHSIDNVGNDYEGWYIDNVFVRRKIESEPSGGDNGDETPANIVPFDSANTVSTPPTPYPPGPPSNEENISLADLSDDTVYYIKLKTYDERPNESEISNSAYAKTKDIVAPGKVTNLAGMPGWEEGMVQLNWISPGDNGYSGNIESGKYFIKFSTDPADNFDTAISSRIWTGENAMQGYNTEKQITNLTNGVTYYFYIKIADEEDNFSGVSNTTSTYAMTDIVKPDPITNLAVQTGEQVELQWSSPGDNGMGGDIVNGQFHIKYTSDPASGPYYNIYIPTNTSPNSYNHYTLTGLKPRTSYYIQVRTGDEVTNWSDWQNGGGTNTVLSGSHYKVWESTYSSNVQKIIWGDIDNDGYLD